ncbi:MAG: adenylate/guanylate cyclase domain-containing protein [Anaerolineae bacterium]
MPNIQEQIAQLESAIAAQESMRAVLGDAVVNLTQQALRAQLDALRAQQQPAAAPALPVRSEELLARLSSFLPKELADKMRSSGRIESERKQVTVMFADLSGFTALSELMDAEEVTTLANEALKELATAVYEYEGYIDKFTGDAIMAIFGAPIAHEDDPERALRAALRMREKMAGVSERWRKRLGQPLTIHIGISTGPVVAGNVSPDNRLSYTVMGDAVNTAARLEDASQPGQILVNRDTFRLTEEAFVFSPLPPITAKGKRQPLVVYAVERARLHPEKVRGLKDLASAFVGREQEMQALRHIAGDLLAGSGHVVTITGEAGIGKSRLMAEWRNEISGQAAWLEGRSFAHTSSLAYGPFLDLIRRYVGIRDEDSEAEARERLDVAIEIFFTGNSFEAHTLFANLLALHLTPQEAEWIAGFQPESLRQRMYEMISNLLTRLTHIQPILLVLEDMHWADHTSLDLIERLLPLTRKIPLGIVCAFRLEAGAGPEHLLNLLRAEYSDCVTSLTLTPLSESSSLEMVEQLLASPELPPAVRQLILRRTEGNPFFVEEVIRSLIDGGVLIRAESDEGWQATPLIEGITVPDTLQGLLAERLDRLPDNTKWTAQQAAVIGRIFLYRVLLHISENTPRLDMNLSQLERGELIRERTRLPEVEYIFKHALTQEVAYSTLLAPRRKELHRKVGAALESIFADRINEFRSIIAEHYWRGEEWDKAVAYLTAAGDAATRLYANAEARLHYGRALEAFTHLMDTAENRQKRVDTIIKYVSVAWTADPPDKTIERLSEAEALAKELPAPEGSAGGDPIRLANVQSWKGRLLFARGQLREAIGLFQQVLATANQFGDEELAAFPSSVLGRVLVVQGKFAQAGPLLAKAIPTLERMANWPESVQARGGVALSLSARGDYPEALAHVEQAIRHSQEIQYLSGDAIGHQFLSLTNLFAGHFQRALEANAIAIERLQQSGDRVYVYIQMGVRAWAQSHLDQIDAALESLARQRELAQQLGGQLVLTDWFGAVTADVLLKAGRVQEAIATADRVVTAAKPAGALLGPGMAERAWGEALAALDPPQWEEADAHLASSLQMLEAGDSKMEAARTRLAWGRVYLQRKDSPSARAHFEKALAQFESSGSADEARQAREWLARTA